MRSAKLRLRQSLPTPVLYFLFVSFVVNLIAVTCEVYSRYRLHLPFPYRTPVLGEPPAPDLLNFDPAFKHLHTAEFFSTRFPVPYMYPAAVAPLYSFFLGLPLRVRVFHCTIAVILLAAAISFGLYLWRNGLKWWRSALLGLGTLGLSYPALFELKQSNMEIFVCVLVAVGVLLFFQARFHWAAVCFGLAIAMKIFPFVYLGLFFSRRRYGAIGTAVVVAIVATLCSLAYLGPSITTAWHGVSNDLHYYQQTVPTVMREEIGYDHTLFALLKRVIHQLLYRHISGDRYDSLLRYYMPLVGVFGLLLYFLRIRHLPTVNQVLCLAIASILLPPTSYDYTLLHIYTPWALLVLFALSNNDRRTKGLTLAFICLALATSIETELIFHARSLGGQFKALVLLALFGIALRFPFKELADHSIEPSKTAAHA